MEFANHSFSQKEHLFFYEKILLPRLIEEKMLLLLRQGKITKWFSGIGQEAIAVGSALALDADEYMLPLHRNLGVFTSRGVPLEKLFCQFMGKYEGFTKGRDRSFHFGSREHHIIGMISHLGAQLPVADGIALARKLKSEKKATLVFTGEGGTSEGDFHEALNIAAVWQLPVIFLIENNGYALSTPVAEQFRFDTFVHKGPSYGIEAKKIDGNNLLEVYHEISAIARMIRKVPQPYIVEAVTFRRRGHEEASGVKYVPEKLMRYWEKKDPVVCYEKYLLQSGLLKSTTMTEIKHRLNARISEAWSTAAAAKSHYPLNAEQEDVYAPASQFVEELPEDTTRELRYVDAIKEGIDQCLDREPALLLMGQDIAEYGGAFKVTEGLVEKYGKERVRNTPLCESGILGAAFGLSVAGFKSIVEMQFADFVSCGFNQLVNNLAKSHYRWGQPADVVVRMPTGAGTGAGPFHSQSTEAWFFHVPGLKIVYPSNPMDAKGLLVSAVEEPNPVMYFEHKYLYRTLKGNVPESHYRIPIGKGRLIAEGKRMTVVTYGMGVHWVQEEIRGLPAGAVELIDLRSLLPWDKELVFDSVKKTGKVLIVHEDTLTGGIGAEISASIAESCFELLDAPVRRVGAADTPAPFAKELENHFLTKHRLNEALRELLEY